VKILLGEAGFTVKRNRQKVINVQLTQQIIYRSLGTPFTETAWSPNTNPAALSTETFIEPESEIVILKRNSGYVRMMRTGLMCWLTAGGVTGMTWQRNAINSIQPSTKCSSPATVFRFYTNLARDFLHVSLINRDSSLGTVTRYELDDRGIVTPIPGKVEGKR
jgi:hypothetical protein